MKLRPTTSTRSQRRRIAAALALLGLALLAPALVQMIGRSSQEAELDARSQLERVLPVPKARSTSLPARRPHRAQPRPVRRVWMQMPAPVRLAIPAIGVSAPIIPVGLNDNGTTETPDTVTDTGWFAPGPEPGEKGAALLVGHVDSYRGPGVFYHLRALRRGDRINVVLRDRRRVRFVVTGARQAPKLRFPSELVYKRTPRPTLRLVTCGGPFDRSTGHYIDNYIVFAHLAEQA